MKVLVVGGGGREHVIVSQLTGSPKISKLYCAPGNGGIASLATCENIKATDINGMIDYVKMLEIDFVVVAPDDPLALGMVDKMEASGIRAFGPYASAAIIESSKAFSKGLMQKYGIPTAEYAVFSDTSEALRYLEEKGAPIVIKADGLALGKGVVVAMDEADARAAIISMLDERKFGESGANIVIEEYLTGPEVTVLCFTDGKTIKPMPSSQDHKRAYDDDKGPNTGGMGAISPSPYYTEELAARCMNEIFVPTIEAMNKEGRPFKGVLYFGLMLTDSGPKVIEYNARFGDPEAQAVLSLLDSDLLEIMEAIVDERLDEVDISWTDEAAACVVMASGGYPGDYKKNYPILGLKDVPADIMVYHAGTKLRGNSLYLTAGGRVLGVTAVGACLEDAVDRAYEGVGRIDFTDAHYRTDIGRK